VRWDDPAVRIEWPVTPQVISDKDKKWPDLNLEFHQTEMMRGLT
jgi:dTDP-4-dehydrorhamnose 3,5-epimerase